MDGSECPVEIVAGVPIVAAPEEIDITNAPFLRSAMLEAAAHGDGTLVVDMTLTRFCDSSGLHALLAAHKRAQAEGGELLVITTAPAILRVFALTGVDCLIPRFSSLDDALAQAALKASRRRDDDRAETELVAKQAPADLAEDSADSTPPEGNPCRCLSPAEGLAPAGSSAGAR